MTRGPLGGPRPLAASALEINVYFSGSSQQATRVVDAVETSAKNHLSGVDSVTGMHGTKSNVVSVGLKGNQTSLSKLRSFESDLNSVSAAIDVPIGRVDDIEVIG